MKKPTAFAHFIEAFESSVERFAEKPALHFLGDGVSISESVTFAALREEARTLSMQLQRRCPPGGRVLLMLDSSIDYVRAFLGCLYGGLIAVPLYPLTSRRPRHLDRVRSVIASAEPSLILCEAAGFDIFHEMQAELALGSGFATMAQLRKEAHYEGPWRQPSLDGDTIAFLQYTSGSTGAPKGVVVRHRNLVANLHAMRHVIPLTEQDRVVSWLPLFHDMGLIGAVLASLYSGITCHLMAPKTFLDSPVVWLKALSRYRGTTSFAPNLAYQLCIRVADEALLSELDLSHWANAFNGAEPIHPGTITAFCRRFAPAGFKPGAFRPGYGQAEATLAVSTTSRATPPVTVRVKKAALEKGQIELADHAVDTVEFVACGYPIPGHHVVIVNPSTGERCAENEVGEIWLSGPSNADAYWRNEEASAETFHARLAGDEARYVRSGDLGFLYQGQLVICGRLKDLIIVNGRNIYPPDLEFAIADAEPAIRAGRVAAFSVWDEELGREKVIVMAELRRRPNAGEEAALYANIRQAAYDAADCVIDQIVLVEPGVIPTTTSGKLSRQGARKLFLQGKLPVVAHSTLAETPDVKPVTSDELKARIAQGHPADVACLEYLQYQVQRLCPGVVVGSDASLLQLGLDSLAISALKTRVAQDLGWSPSLSDLFGEKTLAELAAMWASQRSATALAAPIQATDAHEPAPLSFAQQRLWFLHELEPQNPQHNIVVHIVLRGPLDREALEKSFSLLIERHGVLRTRYRNGPLHAEQVMERAVAFSLTWDDISAIPEEAQRHQIEDCLAAERATPFDLTRPPLLRARLYTCAPESHELILCVHHIAFDGRSAEIFLDELGLLYRSLRHQKAPPLAAPTLQYSDFARWERSYIDNAFTQAQLAFWRDYLKDVPKSLSLGALPVTTPQPCQHRFLLERGVYRALQRYSRESGLTLFMTLLTLYGVLLRHFSGQERFLIGTDVDGRWRPETEGLIGFFVNQLAIRCDHTDAPTLRALFARQGREAQLAYAHQELPFDLLVSALAPSRSPNQAPLFQVKLNYQPSRTGVRALDDLQVEQVQVYQERGAFDLVLDLVHGRESIAAELKFDAGAFGPLWGARFQGLWEMLLRDFSIWLDQPLSALLQQLKQRDSALQLELGRTWAVQSRAQLGQIKRQPRTM